ncbi:hypothetical protein RRG08_037180 [Elysia crispata]|uniref:Uncharacterized protein n=1 Tax=Elysia crispata TaxID=231223 RepID=A0AAE0Z3I0_9GAST|nr:hypothetical protein RRG08_037180 [Elysia crispata]
MYEKAQKLYVGHVTHHRRHLGADLEVRERVRTPMIGQIFEVTGPGRGGQMPVPEPRTGEVKVACDGCLLRRVVEIELE